MTEPPVIALDIGQTGMRIAINRDQEEYPEGARALVSDTSANTVAAMIATRIAGRAQGAVLSLGITGFTAGLPYPSRLASELLRLTGASSVIVASDTVTAYLGTVGLVPGQVAICGTGAAILGWDGSSTWKQVDGHGYALGDHGGGYWIGQQGLRAAFDSWDGRGGSPNLARAASRLGTPDEIYRDAHGGPSLQQYIAGFAPAVLNCAHEGDPVAIDIVEAAAAAITQSLAAARSLAHQGRIALTGGLTRSPRFVDAVLRHLAAAFGENEVAVIPDAGLVGASILGDKRLVIQRSFPGLVDGVEGGRD